MPARVRRQGVGLFGEFVVEVPDHLDVVGDKTDRADDDGFGAGRRQRRKVIGDIGFQPRDLGWPGAGLPHLVEVVVAGRRGDQSGGVAHLARIQIRPAAVGGAQRDRMRGEHQAGVGTQRLR